MWSKNDLQTIYSLISKPVPSNSMGGDYMQLQISRLFYFLEMFFLENRGMAFSWKLALLSGGGEFPFEVYGKS